MPGFGVDGVVSLDFFGPAVGMPDGSIVVARFSDLIKLRSDGTMDSSFGTGGTATLVHPTSGERLDSNQAIVALDTKRTLIAGEVYYVVRADGTLDPQFGVGGIQQPPGGSAPVRSMLARPDSQSGTHLVIDVFGWFTNDSAPVSSSGLFVPAFPTRLLDTRLGLGSLGACESTRLFAAGTAVVPPRSAGSVVVNVTATQAAAPGFVTAYPAAESRPSTSTLNLERAGQTVANLSVLPMTGRAVDLFSQSGAHLVVDTAGWFVA